jgi:hypothetical protein
MERIGQQDALEAEMFYRKRDIAKLLKCSERHVTNLKNSGRIPQPVYIDSFPRWPKSAFLKWVEDGVPAITV